MTPNLYALWLNDEQLCRYRKDFGQWQDSYQRYLNCLFIIICSISLIFSLIILFSGSPVSFGTAFFVFFTYLLTFFVFLWSAFFSSCIENEKWRNKGLFQFLCRLRPSPAYNCWTQQQESKAFTAYYAGQAEAAGICPKTVEAALARFLSGNDISHCAFYDFCRKTLPDWLHEYRQQQENENRLQQAKAEAVKRAADAIAKLAGRRRAAMERQAEKAAWNDQDAVHVSANW